MKPHPRIFELALAQSPVDIKAGEWVHVGDSLSSDCAGARGHGMLTILYAPHWSAEDAEAPPPEVDAVVTDLAQITMVLEAWAGSSR